MDRHVGQREHRGELGLERLLALEHLRVGLADHLDVAHRVVEVLHPEVEVVQPERLLEHRRVRFLGDRQDRRAVVEHVVPADHPGAVGQPVRVAVAGRGEQDLGRVGGPGRDDHEVRAVGLLRAAPLDDHPLDGRSRPRSSRGGATVARVRMAHVRVLERGPDPEHLGVGLGLDEAREPVAGLAADAAAVGQVVLEQADAARCVERVVAGPLQVVGELLDPRLVGQRRVRVLGAGVPLGRVLAVVAVYLVELLGAGVVRLEVVVRDRPGR